MKGVGTVNDYTFLNAYRTNNPTGPIRMGVTNTWDRLNILYSQWYFEYALLDRVYTGLIAANPYDLAVDIPWVAKDWDGTGTYIDPRDGLEKSVVTYWFRNDAGAAEPGTGNAAGTFNADDFIFTVWYNYAFDDSWQWSSFMDVRHIEKVNDYQVKVYFDDVSYWFQYAPGGPLIGPSSVLTGLLCEDASATFTGADLVEVQPGYWEYAFIAYPEQVVFVTSATKNGNPIVEGTDFIIRTGYDVFCHGVFTTTVAPSPSDVYVINYKRPIAGGAGGTYLGGNLGYDWTDTMYSYGTHYPVSISSASAALNKNPHFFMDTPLLGEIDWRWNWIGATKPRSGNFKIDILDVVKVTGAYSSRGDGVFDPLYLAGADLDGSDLCHIGILDLVTITGKYGQTFS